MNYHVFNGDADGLCAVHQLLLDNPVRTELVTGLKRDIRLLERVKAHAGERVTVLDISLNSNRAALVQLLEAGAAVEYFDHHYAGEIPIHPNLTTHIDTSADVCTSLLVDRYLEGKYRFWAIAAAFGDNISESANRLALQNGLIQPQIEKLAHLGECLNYNSYGESLEDLHFHPLALYEALAPYPDPFDFVAESAAFKELAVGFLDDTRMTASLRPLLQHAHHAAYLLPDAAWARRVSGVFANKLANDNPRRAHAVITIDQTGGYKVSVRAPLVNPEGADTLCMKFETGGGRKAAGGINNLPENALDSFLVRFAEQFS
jgi:hypothetical protein